MTNIKTKQIEELANKNYLLSQKNTELQEEIREITSSSQWRLLYLIKNPRIMLEKSFYKVFPYWLIPRPIKEKIKQVAKLERTKEKDFNFRIGKILESNKEYKGDIIVYSVIAWNYRFQRPQQLATQFQKRGYRVWYVKNDFIISSAFTPNKYPKVYKVSEDIYEITLPSRSPLFIYQDSLNENNVSVMRNSLNILINATKMKNIIQKVDHPFWANLATAMPFPVIYDCMDDHQAFELGDKKEGNERIIATKASDVIVTSNYLKDKMARFNKKVIPIRNACDYDHFSKENVRKNKLVANLKSPVIGYYGALAEWFDIKMVASAIKNNPGWNFVLIGAVSDDSIHKLKEFPNVHFFGEQQYSKLPSFLAGIDVCIIPFKLTPLIKATDPVKFYEMLAAGKPVVAAKIPEISHHEEPILYTVSRKQTLDEQIRKALKEDSDKKKKARRRVAKENTWEVRAEEYDKVINNIYPKASIVIVAYNNWQLTKNCLDSLEQDGYPNKEIIVVDNLSSDQTRNELKILQKEGKTISILNKKNYGFAKGNNIGIKKASGKYISLLNNDVEVPPFWIQKMIRHLRNDNSIGLIGPVTNESGNETKIPIKGIKQRIIETGNVYANNNFDKTFDINVLPAQCWFMEKNVMNKVGYLDERFGVGMFEDDDYCLRVKRLGKRVVCTEDVFIYHKGKASFNLLTDENYKELFDENKEKFEKKWKIKWAAHKHRKMKSL